MSALLAVHHLMRYHQMMRTTLDIDSDVLQAAKEIAARKQSTAGQVISDLARRGLTAGNKASGTQKFIVKDGWVTLQRRGDTIVTTELVERLLDNADLEEAGLKTESQG